jgi:hypothetical protein
MTGWCQMTAASSGTLLIISVLSLVVAILALFFGPLIARANVQLQLQAAAREARMREFREQVAALLAGQRDAEIKHAQRLAYHRIRLLFVERERTLDDKAFIILLDRFMQPGATDEDARAFARSAEHILRSERSRSWDPGGWTTLGTSLGLFGATERAGLWQPWVVVRGLVPPLDDPAKLP